jgi:carboxypeptidase C (cathepsin A)
MAWLVAVVLAAAAGAQDRTTQPTTSPEVHASRPATQAAEGQQTRITEHALRIGDVTLNYQARAGFIPLKDNEGKTRAQVFVVAYDKDLSAEQRRDRPITFVFNGGPGAAAIWLHLGTAGPKRVGVPENGALPAPPYRLEDNPYTWLDFTDLVFIDPVGTGFSRAEGDRAKEFYNVEGDIASVADVIRLYLTLHDRWASPKFIAGESYGTTRAAGLSSYLHDRFGIDASGIVLISTVLNFQTLSFPPGNDMPYPLWLPSYTAVAWYHKKLPQDLQAKPLAEVVTEAQKWATDTYMPALLRGTSLDDGARQQMERQLARYTGLPLEYVRRSHLKITPGRFEKTLLRDDDKLIGRMDARIIGHDAHPLNDEPDYDPSLSGFFGVFSTCFNDYVKSELKFESERPYEFLTSVGPWDFSREGYLDVSTRLSSAITQVPSMKVMIASGYFDLATPFGAADHTVNQMPLGSLRKNITQKYYEGGHMLYLNHPSLVKLHDDLRAFYQAALPTTRPATAP